MIDAVFACPGTSLYAFPGKIGLDTAATPEALQAIDKQVNVISDGKQALELFDRQDNDPLSPRPA